ncbi:MAG: DUF1801 domain-containing protein [Paracoccaceae bacterium]|jgi:hypothetical protein|nr:DUF1801 domain-containing protein [Paracoccaceae bacterium]
MAENKTKETMEPVEDFLYAVDNATRRADGLVLNDIFKEVTGYAPKMWGPSIVGYGSYHYTYASGREGDSLATGFSPRKANISIYVMPGYADYSEILSRIGKHKMGKSCLYVNKLADIDIEVLKELIRVGLGDLDKKWPVKPS